MQEISNINKREMACKKLCWHCGGRERSRFVGRLIRIQGD